MIKENDLPDGWEVVELLEHLNLVKSGVKDFSGFKKYVATGSLKTGKITDHVEVEYETRPSRANMEVKENDIIFAKMKDTMKIFLVSSNETKYIFSTGFSILRVMNYEMIHPDYVFYWLKSSYFQNQKNKECTGATQKAINESKMKKFKIPLPPLQTQKKIVAILEKAERLKEWRKESDKLTDEFLKSTFLEMFGDPVFNPNKWKAVKLQEVAKIVSGVTKGRKLSGKDTVFVPYMRVANVQDGYLDLNEIKTIEVLPSDVEKFALKDGDVLLTEGGDRDKLGRGAVWQDEIPNCIHQNHIFRVRVNKECLSPTFLSMLIGSPYGKMYFLKSAKQTTGIASINSKQLKNFPAYIPPLKLQQKFASIVQQVEQLREYQSQSKQHIDDLFNVLMQKAFKGELI